MSQGIFGESGECEGRPAGPRKENQSAFSPKNHEKEKEKEKEMEKETEMEMEMEKEKEKDSSQKKSKKKSPRRFSFLSPVETGIPAAKNALFPGKRQFWD